MWLGKCMIHTLGEWWSNSFDFKSLASMTSNVLKPGVIISWICEISELNLWPLSCFLYCLPLSSSGLIPCHPLHLLLYSPRIICREMTQIALLNDFLSSWKRQNFGKNVVRSMQWCEMFISDSFLFMTSLLIMNYS